MLCEIDSNISDILTSIGDNGSVFKGKDTTSNGNLHSVNFSFSIDCTPIYTSTKGNENDNLDDDLSALLDSCRGQKHQSSGITSLDALAKDYLSNNFTSGKKQENIPFCTILTSEINEIPLSDCLEDILFGGKNDSHNQKSCSENLLNTLQWEQSSVKNCGIKEQNHILEQSSRTVDDEMIPDIDLNFCIKKNKNDKFSPMSVSPESLDSGFDEMGFSSEKSDTCSSDDISSVESSFGKSISIKPPLIRSKQSLLFKAISAQPRTDKFQKEKLQNISKELLRKCVTKAVFEYNQDQHLKKYKNITDQSAQCVIKSSFITLPGQ